MGTAVPAWALPSGASCEGQRRGLATISPGEPRACRGAPGKRAFPRQGAALLTIGKDRLCRAREHRGYLVLLQGPAGGRCVQPHYGAFTSQISSCSHMRRQRGWQGLALQEKSRKIFNLT